MSTTADVDVAAVASLIGDRTRLCFLEALLDQQPRSLTELAGLAHVTAATASAHLAKLVDGRLVVATKAGRHRRYELAGSAVATALEALSVIAPIRPARSLRAAATGQALAAARTCYDHLAGRLGVALMDALLANGWLTSEHADDTGLAITTSGRERFEALGIDMSELERGRRPVARACLDWSERRHHLAGALGAALAQELFRRQWLQRRGGGRAVRLTPAGELILERELGILERAPG